MALKDHLGLTGRQLAAARTLVGLSQAQLAEEANISVSTLKRMEACQGKVSGYLNNILAVKEALEDHGIDFTNGDSPGIRLRKQP